MRYLTYIFLAGLILLVGCGDSTTDTEQVATPSPQESVARSTTAPEPEPRKAAAPAPAPPVKERSYDPADAWRGGKGEALFSAIAKEGQEYLSLDTTTVTENLPQMPYNIYGGYDEEGDSVTFTDNLITNTHPDFNMIIEVTEEVFDDEGFLVGEMNYGGHCIRPNETWRYRLRTHVDGIPEEISKEFKVNRVETEMRANVLKEEYTEFFMNVWVQHHFHIDWEGCYNEPDHYMLFNSPTKKEIDESLLDEVEIIISDEPEDLKEWGAYTVEIKNRSANEVEWRGEYEIKDEFGYILHRSEPSWVVGPNQRQSIVVPWTHRPNFYARNERQLGEQIPFGYVSPHCFYVDEEGNQCSELGVEFPTLVTTHLKAR